MPKHTIKEIKQTISSLDQVSETRKIELNNMLDELDKELINVEPAQAKDIANSACDAINSDKESDMLDKFGKSVSEFETEHPKLVDTVNRLCIMLSDIGI